jgi:hypothetical protein
MYAFTRTKGGAAVLCAINVAAKSRALPTGAGQWHNILSAETVAFSTGQMLAVPAHGWLVLVAAESMAG